MGRCAAPKVADGMMNEPTLAVKFPNQNTFSKSERWADQTEGEEDVCFPVKSLTRGYSDSHLQNPFMALSECDSGRMLTSDSGSQSATSESNCTSKSSKTVSTGSVLQSDVSSMSNG